MNMKHSAAGWDGYDGQLRNRLRDLLYHHSRMYVNYVSQQAFTTTNEDSKYINLDSANRI